MRREDVDGKVADLAPADRENPARAVETIREYAHKMLEKRGAPEEGEDTVLDVMDFLTGLSSNLMKL